MSELIVTQDPAKQMVKKRTFLFIDNQNTRNHNLLVNLSLDVCLILHNIKSHTDPKITD